MNYPQFPPKKPHHSFVKILLISIATFFFASCGKRSSMPSRSEADNSGVASALVLPVSEAAFIDVVSTTQHGSPQAENDMQRGGVKTTRDEGVCRVLAAIGFRAEDWIGAVTKIDSKSDGNGVMAMSLSKDLTVMTWNNDLSDIGDNTLIQPRTELFETASLLKEGQPVAFSGTFIPDTENCIKESSITLRGKLDNPEFIFRFFSIARYTPSAAALREQRSARVPFVGCKSDGQSGPVEAPVDEGRTVTVDADAEHRLSYYESETGFGVLAPRGWYCFGIGHTGWT